MCVYTYICIILDFCRRYYILRIYMYIRIVCMYILWKLYNWSSLVLLLAYSVRPLHLSPKVQIVILKPEKIGTYLIQPCR